MKEGWGIQDRVMEDTEERDLGCRRDGRQIQDREMEDT